MPLSRPAASGRADGDAEGRAAEMVTESRQDVRYEWDRPFLYPKQQDAVYDPARYSVIEASTKSGKTVGCLVWMTEKAMLEGQPGHNYWWIAPVYAQAKVAYRRMVAALPRHVFSVNETELWILLINGARVWFKSGEKADNLYGEDVHAAVIDEATRLREESWHAIRSTLSATRGQVRIIGNVKGRKNWAYQMARRAEVGQPGMAYHKIIAGDAVAAGLLDADEVEDARATLPSSVFRELYLAEPSDDSGNPFTIDAIRACTVGELSPLPPVAFGIDLAKSMDWTVIAGLDATGGLSVLERFQSTWEITTPRIIDVTTRLWTWTTESGGAVERHEEQLQPAVIVDSTGVGDPIVERLQAERPGIYEGFKFSAQSKQQLMEELAVAIQGKEITYPAEGWPLVTELEMFEYEYTRTGVRYTAPEGFHDDCVDALGLAVRAWRTRPGRPNIRWL